MVIICYPGTFVIRGIHGNVFLFSVYRVQRTKLNKIISAYRGAGLRRHRK